MRQVVNAILYLVVGGIVAHVAPRISELEECLPLLSHWRTDGTWQRMHDTLRPYCADDMVATNTRQPVVGQPKRQTTVSRMRGDDAKHIKGRKRHVLVDTLGLLLTVVVTTAAVEDRDGARTLLRICPALQETASHLGRWRLSRPISGLGS